MTTAAPFATGPGNAVVATYPDPVTGEETYLTRVSAPGQPQAEYLLYLDLRQRGVDGDQVTALHTELSPSRLPGGYTLDFVSHAFPNAKLSCTQQYGEDADERAKAVDGLVRQAALMSQDAGQQAAPAPNRAPVPAGVAPVGPVPDQALGQQLAQVFGPRGVYRFDGNAVVRSQLPDQAKSTLAWAGLPSDMPFFFTADRPDKPLPGGFLADAATVLRAYRTEANESTLNTLAGHVRIGTDGAAAITVQCNNPAFMPTKPGQVWAVPTKDAMGYRVNAGVSQFAQSLLALAITRQRMTGLDPYAAGAAVAAFQWQLVAIDTTALDNPLNWWSVIVEQMWHGLF